MSETKTNAQNNEISLMIKNAMILFLITLIAGVLLGFVYDNTKASIAEQTALEISRPIRRRRQKFFLPIRDTARWSWSP